MTDPTRKTVETLQRPEGRHEDYKGRQAVEKNFKALATLKVEYVSTDSIYPNSYNPNRQNEREFELLCASITEDGFTQPVVVQAQTREIVDGEHRWRAASQLGYKEIPVVFVEMTPEQMRVATLRHNRARGSEDIELTIAVLKDLQALGAIDHAVKSLQMSDRELNALISDLSAPEAQAAVNFTNSWVPAPPTLSPLVQLGNGKLETATKGALQKMERVNVAITQATSEEEYQVLAQQHKWQAFVVNFSQTEAQRLLDLCGANPAEGVLQMCIHHLELKGIPLFTYK